ncbi:MAG TPA: thioredoxin domain-containing protein [Gemmatimonadaceae bacterium]|nr:thioredoxin domain-containing protein [Gemmatimonadaceae bacterium]
MGAGRGRRNVVKAKKSASSMRSFYILLAAVAVVGIGAIIWQTQRPEGGTRWVENVEPGEAEGYLMGDPNAPVTIYEFADFECPACATWATVQKHDVVQRLVATGQANLRFFDFPLPMHQNTTQAHNAAACAADQDKFWEMHDAIFVGQPEWAGNSRPKRFFEGYARNIGLDVSAWESCYENGTHLPRILANKAEGDRRGVNSTPTFVIGRRLRPGVLPFDVIKAMVDSAAAEVTSSSAAATPSQ